MPLLTADILRLRCDVDKKTAPFSVDGVPLVAWLARDLTLEIGVFINGEVVDPTNWASLAIQIKDVNPASAVQVPSSISDPLIADIVTDFATITADQWQAGGAQHATVALSAAQMNVSLTADTAWLIITVTLDTGEIITPAAGPITLRSTGQSSAVTNPPDVADYIAYSKNESDARFLPIAGSGYRKRDGYLQLYDSTTSSWHTLFVSGGTLVIGPADVTA